MIREALLQVLACPACSSRLVADPARSVLSCVACGREAVVDRGIPRFVGELQEDLARRTRDSFGYEWTHFPDWTDSGTTNFAQYFSDIDLSALRDARVLDAGCGMGRHARMLAPHVKQLVAVDFSAAIEQAAINTQPAGNVDCVQGDIMALPVADEAFDFAYSMGVLHHIADTPGALRNVVRKVRPGGRVRVYLYWKHHGLKGVLLSAVDAARRVTTRLPHATLKALCWLLSVVLMAGVILPYRALWALGVRRHSSWPLFVYRPYPFRILFNDQFDRFSAPLEQRFDADQVKALLERAGLRDVVVRPSFGWIGEGVR